MRSVVNATSGSLGTLLLKEAEGDRTTANRHCLLKYAKNHRSKKHLRRSKKP